MKCRARHHVYFERAKATGNPALVNIAAMENDLLLEAELDWRAALAHWLLESRSERSGLAAIVVQAKDRARREVYTAFDDKITSESLAMFFDSLKPEELIPQGAL
jgi:hypothetical protein